MPPAPTAVIDWFRLYVSPAGSASGFVNPVRRAVWYGFNTSTPADGSTHTTPATSVAETIASSARWAHRTPATNRTAANAAMYTSAVPRSGCRNTSSIGAIPSPIALSTVRRRPSCRWRSARNPAIASTNRSFPNSDGWNWIGPRSIHRFEPRTASANA